MADQRKFVQAHNQIINLARNQVSSQDFHELFTYLERSRINFVITHNPIMYQEYLQEFWRNAENITPLAVAQPDNDQQEIPQPFIRTTVGGHQITFTAEQLREILHLGEEAIENGPTVFGNTFLQRCFQRMGYVGEMHNWSVYKVGFYEKWRFLAHVLIVSISNRRAGFDMINIHVASQMVALTFNRPYSFSKYFFGILKDQVDAQDDARFLILPRLVMAIINHLIPNLRPQAETYQASYPASRIYSLMKNNKRYPYFRNPPLFGHLIDPNYGAPVNAAAGGNNDAPPPPPPPPGQQQPQQQPHPQPQPQQQQQPLPQPQQQPPQPQPRHQPHRRQQPQPQPQPQQPQPQQQQPPRQQQPQPSQSHLGTQDNDTMNDLLDQAQNIPPEEAEDIIVAALNPNDPVSEVGLLLGLQELRLPDRDHVRDAEFQNMNDIFADVEDPINSAASDEAVPHAANPIVDESDDRPDPDADLAPPMKRARRANVGPSVQRVSTIAAASATVLPAADAPGPRVRFKFPDSHQSAVSPSTASTAIPIEATTVSTRAQSSTAVTSATPSPPISVAAPVSTPSSRRTPMKPARTTTRASATTASASTSTSTPKVPLLFKINMLESQNMRMIGKINSLEKDLADQKLKYDTDMEAMKALVAKLADDSAARFRELEAGFKSQGGEASGLACKDDELARKRREDKHDDSDAARDRHVSEPMNQSHAMDLQQQESGNAGANASTSETRQDKGKTPATEQNEDVAVTQAGVFQETCPSGSANLNGFVDSDLEAEHRIEVVLKLPAEERAFCLSESPEPSRSPVLAIEGPMSENFAFDIDDLENMPKTKSKKANVGGRRFPLRSGTKKPKINETISIEDDPEQKSSSSPIPAIPISEVVTTASLKVVLERVHQSYGTTIKDLEEAFKTIDKILKEEDGTVSSLKDRLEKREKDWNDLKSEIAILRATEKRDKSEKKSLLKANQSLSSKNQELSTKNQELSSKNQEFNIKIQELEDSLSNARGVLMQSAKKSLLKAKIKMAAEAEAAGHKIDRWDINGWKEELLELEDVAPVVEATPNPEDVTAQVMKDLVDHNMEEADEDNVDQNVEERVDDNAKEDNEMEVIDNGGDHGEVTPARNEGNDDLA